MIKSRLTGYWSVSVGDKKLIRLLVGKVLIQKIKPKRKISLPKSKLNESKTKRWANCSAVPRLWKCSEQSKYGNPKLSYLNLLNYEILKGGRPGAVRGLGHQWKW